MKRKVLIIVTLFCLMLSLHFVSNNNDSYAGINAAILGPLSYHLSPDAGTI